MRLILPSDWDGGIEPENEAKRRLMKVIPDERVAWREVTVQSGDTISEIAEVYGVTSQTLKIFNSLDSDLLQIGQSLRVPALRLLSQSNEAGNTVYIVRQGDSLWKIARKADVSVSTLVKLNQIGPKDVLRIGQKVLVLMHQHPPQSRWHRTLNPCQPRFEKSSTECGAVTRSAESHNAFAFA